MNRPIPTFFCIGAVKSEGALESIEYQKCKPWSRRKLMKLIRNARAAGEERPEVWLENFEKPRVWLRGTAKSWPAVIPPFRCGSPLIVRGDVVRDLEASSLTGMKFQEVALKGLPPAKLLFRRRPCYYALIPTGTMNHSLRIYGRVQDEVALLCESHSSSDPSRTQSFDQHSPLDLRIMPRPDTWNGSDVFRLNDYPELFGEFFATLDFVEFIRESNWAGFTAHPIDAFGKSYVDLRERPWPPSLWYPKCQPDG